MENDRTYAIVRGYAQAAADKAGATVEFFWKEMNYQSFVGPFRALSVQGRLCQNCGRPFANELDIQIGYCDPPRHAKDWEFLHARNGWIACNACITAKGDTDWGSWLDQQWAQEEQEAARQAIEGDPPKPRGRPNGELVKVQT
jgi:hypothetical protein